MTTNGDGIGSRVSNAQPSSLEAVLSTAEDSVRNPASHPPQERALTPADAAEWLHTHLGGRQRKPAAIRKLMRSGLGGVVLRSFHYGRELRTTEADLKRFIFEIRAATERSTPDRSQGGRRSTISRAVDPADEIAAARWTFGADRSSTPESPEGSAEQIQLFAPAPDTPTPISSH